MAQTHLSNCSIVKPVKIEMKTHHLFTMKVSQKLSKKLLIDLITKDKVKPENIGILTAQRKQEDNIKKMIHGLFKQSDIFDEHKLKEEDGKMPIGFISEANKIKFGTVETFQGQERDVIIISNVRATEKLLKHDKKFQLGFSENFKRLNVAISRAKELLIIVGKHDILKKNFDWQVLLEILNSTGYENSIEMDMFINGCPE